MRYKVIDCYEDIFGDTVFVSDSLEECLMFCREYAKDTDGECLLRVYDDMAGERVR